MELTPELLTTLQKQGYFHVRYIEGRGVCALLRAIFTVDLCVDCDFKLYQGRYQYEEMQEAVLGITKWTGKGEPPGNWIKHKGGKEGTYTNPNYKKYFD
jgi:hypothetical protein